MTTNEKIAKIRELMKRDNVQAFIIPSADPHMSESFSDHWKTRRYVSGFTGSAGTYVITEKMAGLWTDGRYYVQAERQIADSEAVLFRASELDCPSYQQYIHDELPEGSTVGLNGKLFSVTAINDMKELFDDKEISVKIDSDYGNDIWEDRPEEVYGPAFYFDEKYCGRSAADKITAVRASLEEDGCDALVVGRLDSVDWLFNVRASDVSNTPIAISYGFISKDEAILFTALHRVDEETAKRLQENGVTLMEYEDIFSYLEKLDKQAVVLCDEGEVNYSLYNAMQLNHNLMLVPGTNPIPLMKSIKNEVEIANTYKAYIKDGCAEAEFYGWLFESLENGEKITEWDCAEKLHYFRSLQDNFVNSSFGAIVAYRDNAAMMHYGPSPAACSVLERSHMLLNDSGSQFLEGTTDTTRTVALGEITAEERHDFTAALQGVIALTTQRFLEGATGSDLDCICRGRLWRDGLNYRCGTGHGVGFFLNVHEAPPNSRERKIPFQEGMYITIEPGVYTEGSHGVRTENHVVVRKDIKNEYGQFYRFDTFTVVPIDIKSLDVSMMSDFEINWLNDYHKHVYDTVAPLVSDRARKWLEESTQPISR